MNAIRRKMLAKAEGLLDEARSILEEVASDEREAFDNMSDGLQASERGQRMEEIADNLNNAVGELEGVAEATREAQA